MFHKRDPLVAGLLLIGTQLISLAVRVFFPTAIVFNQGVFFGLLRSPVAVVIVIVIGVALLWHAVRQAAPQPHARLGAILLLVGALSNILDRVIFGAVIDYIPLFGLSTFNVADIEILLGALLLASHRPNAKAAP